MLGRYQKKVYKNGLTLLTVPIETAQSIIMSVFVKAGSRYEQPRVNGLSHFLEHLHFKGKKKYPTAKKLSEVVDSIGGEVDANTGKEHTQYIIRDSKRKDILDYRNKFYRPGNTIIAVAGNFDAKQLDAMIAKHWSKVSDKKVAGYEKSTDTQKAPRLSIENKKT